MSTPFTLALLAGGKSSRMGRDKAFIPLAGKPIIERILERTADLGQAETILITNRPKAYAHLGLPMFQDILPEKGALGGIYTAIARSAHPYTLTLACDMPFVNPHLLRYMLALRDAIDGTPWDVIVPRVYGHPQGLHAIYAQTCLRPIRMQLETGNLRVIDFYDVMRVRYLTHAEYAPLDPRGLSFFNINTPEDLQTAEALLTRGSTAQ